ncbi:MAG TPA: exodeoxyribonuclease VII large subunit [Candidatus Dojkabacteria bacterium]|nr:exodeoxyribonuclease VII large subunit [Candidatus Dojkabacteria bacterium]HRP51754.1 exodeoxyribonuclease VII large subunit [Candidatus Dojkabacteria bacterium]
MSQQSLFSESIRVSVDQFNELINLQLQSIGEVIVEGEITEMNISKRGGVNLVLKDKYKQAILNVSGYAPRIQGINMIEIGMEVAIWGVPQLYSPYGKFSVSIYKILPIGAGALAKALELLKDQLEKEGLFDPTRKRPLPALIKNIALITAKSSAAESDFLKILKENNTGISIDFYPVSVQGKHSVGEILSALQIAQNKGYDCIVMIRGGGSLEDLSSFNDEKISKAIFASKTPTLVAVGHERDESIAELVSDVRASTPSQAAYYIVVNHTNFIKSIELQADQIYLQIQEIINLNINKISGINIFEKVLLILNNYKYQVSSYDVDFESKIFINISNFQNTLEKSTHELSNFSYRITQLLNDVLHMQSTIENLNPEKIVQKGYAIIKNSKGNIITSVKGTKTNDLLTLKVRDGNLNTKVI